MIIEKRVGIIFGVEIILRSELAIPKCSHESLADSIKSTKTTFNRLMQMSWIKELYQYDYFIRDRDD